MSSYDVVVGKALVKDCTLTSAAALAEKIEPTLAGGDELYIIGHVAALAITPKPNDMGVYPRPMAPMPAVGAVYSDPVFGSALTRLTDCLATPDTARGSGNLGFIMPRYSTCRVFNCNGAFLILQHGSYFGLYDGHGKFLHDLPFEINASSEPCWSRVDAAVLFFLSGNSIKAYNILTGTTSMIRQFTEYKSISGYGEMDLSEDGDHMVLCGDGREVFRYSIKARLKGGVLNVAGKDFDSLYVTPDNNVTITWNAKGTDRLTGIELFDGNMNFLRQVAHCGGHMGMGRDTDGAEILVWTNSNDPAPVVPQQSVVKIRLADASQVALMALDWATLGMHVNIRGGWAFVSAQNSHIGGPENLKVYTDEILAVRVDGSGVVKRIARHMSRPFENNRYNAQAWFCPNDSGTTGVFASNWGDATKPDDYVDTFLIEEIGT